MSKPKKHSEYDRALAIGNRQNINTALQLLNESASRLRTMDSKKLQRNVSKIRKAIDLLVSYNCKNVEEGIS